MDLVPRPRSSERWGALRTCTSQADLISTDMGTHFARRPYRTPTLPAPLSAIATLTGRGVDELMSAYGTLAGAPSVIVEMHLPYQCLWMRHQDRPHIAGSLLKLPAVCAALAAAADGTLCLQQALTAAELPKSRYPSVAATLTGRVTLQDLCASLSLRVTTLLLTLC